jgi:hypothetical protein
MRDWVRNEVEKRRGIGRREERWEMRGDQKGLPCKIQQGLI